MAEDYNYDFSDDESEKKDGPGSPTRETKADDKDEEQQMQKLNGQVETCQKQLADLQASLEAEQAAHADTRRRERQQAASPGGEAEELRRELADLKERHEEEKRELEAELGRARNVHATAPAPGPSTAIRHKVDTLCKLFAIEPPYPHEDDMTEKQCLDVLAQMGKKGPAAAGAGRKGKAASPKAKATPAEEDSELYKRITLLEEELRLALGAAEDIRALKSKVIQLVERLRVEKEDKIGANIEVKRYSKKMEMLGDHIEKLMLHLKHEAGTKIKVSDQLKDSERRNGNLQEKIINLSKKLGAKDRLISELREGSKILEDQLRLMDEKYLELRTKLDYTRDAGAKKIKKAQKMASELRVKFALAGNSTLLDHMPLGMPSNANSNSMANTAPAGAMRGYDNADSFDYRQGQGQGGDLNAVTGPGTTGGGKHGGKRKPGKSKGHTQKGSSAWDQTDSATAEETEARVLEKVRKLQGGKTEWTDDKIQTLLKQK
jgi:hypothetical protein